MCRKKVDNQCGRAIVSAFLSGLVGYIFPSILVTLKFSNFSIAWILVIVSYFLFNVICHRGQVHNAACLHSLFLNLISIFFFCYSGSGYNLSFLFWKFCSPIALVNLDPEVWEFKIPETGFIFLVQNTQMLNISDDA